MLKFILRRFGASIGVLFAASVLLYVLVINSGDPLKDLRESNAENRDLLIERRVEYMNLDMPWYQRYLDWLIGVGKCFKLECDLGTNRSGVEVNSLLALAASSTLRLVLLATVIALVLGILIGVLTAVRQYSGLDYGVTFMTFLFFSLPIFWAAVLLKEYLAIGYNDWIRDPSFTPVQLIVTGLIVGFLMQVFLAGSTRRRIITFAATAIFVAVALPTLTALDFYRNPQLGYIGVAVLTFVFALGATAAAAGLKDQRVLRPALITAALASVLQIVLVNVFIYYINWWIIIAGGILAVVIPYFIGRAMGGRRASLAAGVAAATGFVGAGLTVVDHLFRNWDNFLAMKPRPISTIGSQTPNFGGNFWETVLDQGTQLLLPTLVLTLVSLASYSRYTRSSMLEVNEQDYIRTARSKGLAERTVIFRHAFRNALIPIATIAAFDFAGLIGGAVITESVFGWKGMGELFRTGLDQVDPAPVMAFFLVTGTAAILFNLLADIFYAILDPRIRV
ncbi:ABC transporter permease [Zhihengliuella flava]|uniref:Peptide/nickel transport system permease protein n=1 Tax=Zhihengliuella flava TaxID=1285193 RepID=A0A931DDL8_9MICC|nr:peptide/nickel transport system permease protein [Zhihengliuella flava]